MTDLTSLVPPPPPKLTQQFSKLAFEQNIREVETYARKIENFLRTIKAAVQELQK
jgi:hypothetical protein